MSLPGQPLTAPLHRFHAHETVWLIHGRPVLIRAAFRGLRLQWTGEDYKRACEELDKLMLDEAREKEEM